jgi:hypothetical protein
VKKWVFAFAGCSLAAAGAMAFLVWWNSEASDEKLIEYGPTWARWMIDDQTHLITDGRTGPPTVKFKEKMAGNGAGSRLLFDVDIPRAPASWDNTPNGVHATGTRRVQMMVYGSPDRGDLWARPPPRPKWDSRGGQWVLPPDEGELMWARLETEPANAAFDALMFSKWSDLQVGPVVYLSALRRLKLWKSAIELADSMQVFMTVEDLDAKWRGRLAVEVEAIKAAVSVRERKRLDDAFSAWDIETLKKGLDPFHDR